MPAAGDRPFRERVFAVVAQIGPGELMTYGDVADEAGRPRAARAVGSILAAAGGGALPWWRVVTVTGRLVPGAEAEHAQRLEAEGHTCRAGRVTTRMSR